MQHKVLLNAKGVLHAGRLLLHAVLLCHAAVMKNQNDTSLPAIYRQHYGGCS